MGTTIQLRVETRDRLSSLKISRRETDDQLLSRLMSLVPEGDDEGLYTRAFRLGLLEARLDIREGRAVAHNAVKRRLGL